MLVSSLQSNDLRLIGIAQHADRYTIFLLHLVASHLPVGVKEQRIITMVNLGDTDLRRGCLSRASREILPHVSHPKFIVSKRLFDHLAQRHG